MAKYETKTKPTEVSVEDFIAGLPDSRRREEAVVIDAMLRRVSGEKPVMWGSSIIGYGAYHYRYASGHEGDAARIGFSPRKGQHVLYLMSCDGERDDATKALLARLGKHSLGICCLYVNKLADVDLGVLEELAALSWKEMAELYPD